MQEYTTISTHELNRLRESEKNLNVLRKAFESTVKSAGVNGQETRHPARSIKEQKSLELQNAKRLAEKYLTK